MEILMTESWFQCVDGGGLLEFFLKQFVRSVLCSLARGPISDCRSDCAFPSPTPVCILEEG